MPRTASSQTQSRPSAKARPSANVRAGNLVANTPVLFRLPAIPTAAAQDLAVTFSEAAADLPTAKLAAVALSTAATVAVAAEPVSNVSATPQAAPQQTWWEHWSSGIVLIVLLIALATASILAWQGSNKGNSKLMADTNRESESQSDLSSIEVPRIEAPKLELPELKSPASNGSNSYVDKLEPATAQNNKLQNNSLDQRSDAMDQSLVPNGSLSLTLDAPSNNETKFERESHATASLQSPVVKQQEPLFKDSDLIQAKSNISAQPASTPTQRSATNGDKPSLWDNSKASVHDSNRPLSLEFSSHDASSLSSPSNPTSQPTTSESAGSAKLISQSTQDATSYVAESTAATLVPKEMQNAAKTVTPEMDQAELFAAYRELKAPAIPTKIVNRFGNAAAAGTQALTNATNGIQAAAVGYTQKSTVPPNTQPVPGSNNYTLQPAQNYPTNAPVQQQYSATPNSSPQAQLQSYQNQPYQNPQYPNPQYPNPQYSGQQYSGQQNVPQYSNQLQSGAPNQTSATPSLPYGGAQVPYSTQPSQAPALQLPPGPIGGYGYAPTQLGTQVGQAGSSNSLSYPSMQ